MPRVLVVIDTLEVGGTERSLLELLRRFRRLEPLVCTLYPGGALRPEYEAAGLRVEALDLPGKYSFRRAFRGVLDLVHRERPVLLHAALFRASIVARGVARWTGLPLVGSLVSDSYSQSRLRELRPSQRVKLRCVQRLDRWTAGWSRSFVAVSEATRGAAIAQLALDPDRVRVVHRGRTPPTGAPREEVRARLGLATTARVVLNVSRLTPHKGHADLLRALGPVVERHPSTRLLVAGDGPAREALARLTRELGLAGSVELLGTRNDVQALLAAADVFAFPSHREGLPGALIEAMLAGLPIVASNIAVHREALGDTGLLHPVGCASSLALQLERALSDGELARRLGAAARARADGLFDIDRVADRYERYLEQALEGAA